MPTLPEHPFAQYLRILGKGRQGSRHLSREQAHQAMRMILEGHTADCQTGAFLMLLRVLDESTDEFTGMLEATRMTVPPLPQGHIDLDWPAYAGKRKQLPWYLLAIRVLASRGIRILLHCAPAPGRLHVHNLLDTLQLPWAHAWTDIPALIQKQGWACVDIAQTSPGLARLIQWRQLLGVRSSAHSLARLLNPANAPAMLVPIFHPAYRQTHQAVLAATGQKNALVFKGEGGDPERNPQASLPMNVIRDGILSECTWPALCETRTPADSTLDPDRLIALWQGHLNEPYGVAAVQGTIALALFALGKVTDDSEAHRLAAQWWNERIPD